MQKKDLVFVAVLVMGLPMDYVATTATGAASWVTVAAYAVFMAIALWAAD